MSLAQAGRGGDRRAREQLIQAHLRDVVAIARGYRGYGHPLAELIAVGNLGLVIGVDRFDPDRGLRLMTYAGYWVRAQILSHIVACWSVVELGTSSLQTRLFFGLHRQRARLQARHGEAGVGDGAGDRGEDLVTVLAAHFACQPAQIVAMVQRIDGRDLSVDVPSADGPSLGERLACEGDPEAAAVANELYGLVRRRARRVLRDLDERERIICDRRLFADDQPSLLALGRELGLSRERVRQLEQRVRSKLRRRMLDLDRV